MFLESMIGHPMAARIVYFTGGESLLHADDVAALSDVSRRFGAVTAAISGGFFGRLRRLPGSLERALRSLDTLHISRDRYHEPFLNELEFQRAIRHAADCGAEVCVQYTLAPGETREDALRALRSHFHGDVLFSSLMPVGRAMDVGLCGSTRETVVAGSPCRASAWPVVSYTGQIVLCCNQSCVDARDQSTVPSHLYGGTLPETRWDDVVRRRGVHEVTLSRIAVGGPAMAFGCGEHEPQCSACLRGEAGGGAGARVSLPLLRAVGAAQAELLAGMVACGEGAAHG